jgi:hypothetical protein
MRGLVLSVCTAMLALAGPGGAAFARAEAVTEAESKLPPYGSEQFEHTTIVRTCDRAHAYCMRRAHRAPTGSCAAVRAAGFSRHWSARAFGAEHQAHNGFGGPLLI